MWILVIVFIIGMLAIAAVARRYIPKTYGVINAIAWATEGMIWVLAVAAAIYWYAVGHPF